MDTFTRAGLTFDVRDHGPAHGPVVVCLHGFPQDGTAFDAVVPALVDGGVRVLVPDQRGYSPGARPLGRAAYTLREVVDDVVALLDAAGVGRAHVVGHDWGGVVGWALAGRAGDRVASLTAVSTPHPGAVTDSLLRSTQALRLSYMAWFQLPGLPERLLLARDGDLLRRTLREGGLSPARTEHYLARMRQPGALTAALGWYRAMPLGRGFHAGTVHVPTTLLHGRRDPFVTPAAVRATARFVRGWYRSVGTDAGHWVPESQPDLLAQVVLGMVRTERSAGRLGARAE